LISSPFLNPQQLEVNHKAAWNKWSGWQTTTAADKAGAQKLR
jgi:hypothetical protein